MSRALRRALRRRRCTWCAVTLPWWRIAWCTRWCLPCEFAGSGVVSSPPCGDGSRLDPADVQLVAAHLAAAYEPEHPTPNHHDERAARALLTGRLPR